MATVKVNHTGACGAYTYEAGKAFEVKGDDLNELKKALGDDLSVLEEDKKVEESKKEEAKEAKPDHDKMIHNEKKDTKVVTK